MPYEVKNYQSFIGLPGLSEQLLRNHFTLYEGYVANVNKLNDLLIQMEKDGKFGTPEYSELNRRFGWEWNGMRLHEYYFGNLIKEESKLDLDSKLAKKIMEEFGSLEMWEKDFRSMGTIRGIGWVILYYDKEADKLFNVWINEHDTGHFSGCAPILVMDVFEHAYITDYGLKRADYIGAFFKVINWKIIEERFVNIAAKEFTLFE